MSQDYKLIYPVKQFINRDIQNKFRIPFQWIKGNFLVTTATLLILPIIYFWGTAVNFVSVKTHEVRPYFHGLYKRRLAVKTRAFSLNPLQKAAHCINLSKTSLGLTSSTTFRWKVNTIDNHRS